MKLHIKRHITAQGGMSAPAFLVRMADLWNIAMAVTSYRT